MKLSLENIKWLTIGGLILYIVLLQQCSSPRIPGVGGGGGEIIRTSTDTVTVTHVDTVFAEQEVRYVEVKVPSEPIIITNPIDTTAIAHEYTTEIKDSLVEGTITSIVDGTLIDQKFEYKPLFPQYIYTTDSVIVTNTNEVDKTPKLLLSIGGEIGGNMNAFNISPVVMLSTKRGYSYSYRYGIIDQTHNVGVLVALRFKRK
jgi:hypothetical protein